MRPDDADAEHEQAALQVMNVVEQMLGDDRFGGSWIDRTTPSSPVIGVAIVDLSQDDIEAVRSTAKAGWPIHFVSVRCSRTRLVGMLQALDRTPLPGDAWVGLGWDPRINSIVADLRRWDDDAVSWARERFPEDALVIRVKPDALWGAAL